MTLEKIIKYLKTGELSLYKMARKRKNSAMWNLQERYQEIPYTVVQRDVYANSSDIYQIGSICEGVEYERVIRHALEE
ncbi:MAG: hypothetical protein J7K33_04720 [Candidatus Marinimicrobia bacterium]|nr:hypothetical protein [Candidatus Neomarinimicrobiota bacterium]